MDISVYTLVVFRAMKQRCAEMIAEELLPFLFYTCFSEMLVVFVKSALIYELFVFVSSCVELKASP